MKKCTLYIMLVFFFAFEVIAQNTADKTFSKNGYQTWITTTDNFVYRGLLWMVSQDSVNFKSDQEENWKKPLANNKILKVPVTEIESIRTKRVHAVWKGYGYGVLTGVAVGSVGALIYEAIESDEGSALLIP